MCGRYTLMYTEELGERFQTAKPSWIIRPRYNVAPGQLMPVIPEKESSELKIETMKWGLIPRWAKDIKIGYKNINARAETIFEKPMWQTVIKKQRCLVPATGFYEWKNPPPGVKTKKQPYYIHPTQIDIFAFAGIWENWKDAEGADFYTYSIITTHPNKEMATIHDRMPVILHQEDEGLWLSHSLDGDQTAIEALLQPWEDQGLEMYEISTDVNVTTNDDAELILPLNST